MATGSTQSFSRLSLVLTIEFIFFQTLGFAAPVSDAAKLGLNLPSINSQSASSTSSCTYTASDTYVGTNALSGYGSGPYSAENIGAGQSWSTAQVTNVVAMPAPPLTNSSNNLVLSFRGGSWSSTASNNGTWTSSTPSPLSTPVPCAGTYQIFFTLQLQATNYGGNQLPPQAAPTIKVYPCVQTTDGNTLVYGSFLSGGACPTTGPYFVFNPVCNGGNYCSVVTFPFATQVHLNANQVVGAPVIHATNQINVTGGEFSVYYVGP